MICRREWVKRGAAVVIGGAAVIVGEPVEAAPVRRDDTIVQADVILMAVVGEVGSDGIRRERFVGRLGVGFDLDGSYTLCGLDDDLPYHEYHRRAGADARQFWDDLLDAGRQEQAALDAAR